MKLSLALMTITLTQGALALANDASSALYSKVSNTETRNALYAKVDALEVLDPDFAEAVLKAAPGMTLNIPNTGDAKADATETLRQAIVATAERAPVVGAGARESNLSPREVAQYFLERMPR